MALSKSILDSKPKNVIAGITRGQYTSQADESVIPLNRGRYIERYPRSTVLIPMHDAAAYKSGFNTRTSDKRTGIKLVHFPTNNADTIQRTKLSM